MGCAGIFGGPVTQSHMKECIANVFVVELGGELVEGDVGDGVEEDGEVSRVGDRGRFGLGFWDFGVGLFNDLANLLFNIVIHDVSIQGYINVNFGG